jgi:hypothetical protein
MVSVNMGDEHGLNAGHVMSSTTESGEGRRGCVDDVAAIKEGERVVPPVREEGVPCSQHFDAVGHGAGTERCFFFSSVASDAAEDVKRYQP